MTCNSLLKEKHQNLIKQTVSFKNSHAVTYLSHMVKSHQVPVSVYTQTRLLQTGGLFFRSLTWLLGSGNCINTIAEIWITEEVTPQESLPHSSFCH